MNGVILGCRRHVRQRCCISSRTDGLGDLMSRAKTFVAAGAVMLVFVASPAHAQRRAGGGGRAVAGPRGGVVAGRAVPRVGGPRVYGSAPYRVYQPYYSFRPRFSLG